MPCRAACVASLVDLVVRRMGSSSVSIGANSQAFATTQGETVVRRSCQPSYLAHALFRPREGLAVLAATRTVHCALCDCHFRFLLLAPGSVRREYVVVVVLVGERRASNYDGSISFRGSVGIQERVTLLYSSKPCICLVRRSSCARCTRCTRDKQTPYPSSYPKAPRESSALCSVSARCCELSIAGWPWQQATTV